MLIVYTKNTLMSSAFFAFLYRFFRLLFQTSRNYTEYLSHTKDLGCEKVILISFAPLSASASAL